MQKKLILLKCIDLTVSNEMAASQNPIQGSLFAENVKEVIAEAEQLNGSQTFNDKLDYRVAPFHFPTINYQIFMHTICKYFK